uniref:Uncharacterized protein n=1 Tax=Panagrolaimus sp. PS1159 TaxID=55785 RepID=A0AC35G662_9BILA
MEFKVNLTSRMQEKYNWNDFDLEMALLVEDAISVSAKNVVFLRKKCKGSDLILQFAVLKSQSSIPKNGKNFKNHEKIFEQIRVANHSFHNYMIENGAKFGISEVKEATKVAPLNRMMGPGMGNFCERNELSTPVICNAHRTDRQCICKATKEQAYYGSNVIDCDRLTSMDTSFRTSSYKFGSVAFLETIKTPNPAVFDALFTSELETLMDIPEGSLMIIRKYCKNHKLHVQFVEFENPRSHPPFTESDFSYSSFKTVPISKLRNKMDIGLIAESESASAILLPPIIKDSPEDIPFDATFFVI